MLSSRTNPAPALILSLAVGAWLSATRVALGAQEQPQQTAAAINALAAPADTARAIELYNRGEHEQAIKILRGATKRRKTDAQAWLHLGIALSRADKPKDARKAFERALKLQPDTPQAHIGMAYIYTAEGKLSEAERILLRAVSLNGRNAEARFALAVVHMHQGAPVKAFAESDAALQINPNYGPALLLKKEAALEAYSAAYAERAEKYRELNQPVPEITPEERDRFAGFLREGAHSLEMFLQLFPAERDSPRLREELESLRRHSESVSRNDDEPLVYRADSVTTKAQIWSKAEPLYTEEARKNGVTGTVRLRMVLSFDGKARHIIAVKGLKGGLTQTAINAARRIKFTPATKDGRPVSQFVTIEYNFNIY